ncbi:hypothetical protein PoB_004709600 [Plakobranchus ocellatus]|uniref:Uncharacterized protein n=1 Tax=Plakobranchus ocellatus TaxID=259542 RepID=A0AAV4BB85_9GAST|nr:hypothetical protein PoB_004709600 [Plakobranchus ocellatus]
MKHKSKKKGWYEEKKTRLYAHIHYSSTQTKSARLDSVRLKIARYFIYSARTKKLTSDKFVMAKLTYFEGRGKGELIRLILGACNIEDSSLKVNDCKPKAHLINPGLSNFAAFKYFNGHDLFAE